MAYLSINDPDFWDSCPENLRIVQAARPAGTLAYFLMGAEDGDPPAIAALKLRPGEVLTRHAHDCHRFEIIVQGSLRVDGRELTVGDVMTSEPYIAYGPHFAGPEGCTTFEIFGTLSGSHRPIYETPDGDIQIDATTPEGNAMVRTVVAELKSKALAEEARAARQSA